MLAKVASLARTTVVLALILGLVLAVLGPLQPAQAHDGSIFLVTQLEAARAAPTIDGNCTEQEYAISRSYFLYYEPAFPETEQARIRAVWKDAYFYICISNSDGGPIWKR